MNMEKEHKENPESNKNLVEKVEREKVLQVLQELRKVFLPKFSPLPTVEEMVKGGEKITKLVKPFLGHLERVTWLEGFLEKSRIEMRNTLPEGTGMDVLTDIDKWSVFYKEHEVDGVGGRIFNIARKMREELREKMYGFENKDSQIDYQI